ncbi:MAG TPA: SCO family protein [Planctomycetota bacterium]|nr:SCO family protein [Planctomycetota bacterium]
MSRSAGLLLGGLSVLLLLGIWRVAYAPLPAARPVLPRGTEASEAGGVEWRGRFPNVPLVTHEGRRVLLYDDLLRGHLVAINFFYVECEGTCPGVTSTLVEVERRMDPTRSRELRILSITLQPERDTPERLSEYARRYEAGPRVLFLTGQPEHLDLVKRALGFSHPEDPARDLDRKRHAALLRIGNEAEGWWTTVPSLASAGQIVNVLRSVDRVPERAAAPSAPLDFPGGVPVDLQSSVELRVRQEWTTVQERLERLWMSRIPMDAKAYQNLILSELSAFLRLSPEDDHRTRSAMLGTLADLTEARRRMERFRRGKPYDPDDAGRIRSHRLAWEIYLQQRAEAFARLGAALPAGPRPGMLREQAVRWMSCLEDPPEAAAVPQDQYLVPIQKK